MFKVFLFFFFGIKFIMKKLRNARGKQTKNTASQGIAINQLKPNKHVLANFPEARLCLAERKVV